jgi:hypothetical protein
MNFFKFLKNYWRDMTPLEVVTRELALAHLYHYYPLSYFVPLLAPIY